MWRKVQSIVIYYFAISSVYRALRSMPEAGSLMYSQYTHVSVSETHTLVQRK